MITTAPIENFPSIDWEIGDLMDTDPEERMEVFEAHGEDKEGNEYSGSAYYFCSDFESIKDIEKYENVSLLLDTYHPSQAGGTGNPFPWEIALIVKEKRDFILSGGLSSLNVREVIQKVKPWGVDVSSGVELFPGKKDPIKMEAFVKEVKKADETTG